MKTKILIQILLFFTAIFYAQDIAVNISGPRGATPNISVTYKIYVTNNGPANASNVVVQAPAVTGFTASSISCANGAGNGASSTCPGSVSIAALQGSGLTIPSLPSGSAVVFTVTGTTTSLPATINYAATATFGGTDPNTANNTVTLTTSVVNNTSCSQTTYTLDLAQTLSNNSAAANGGVINLYFNRSSGPAISGISNPLIIPATYSDLNSDNLTNHQWFSIIRDPLIGDALDIGMAGYSDGSGSQVRQTGSVFNGLPANNIKPSANPGIPNISPTSINIDHSITDALLNGIINPLGTFALNLGNPILPVGVRIVSENLILQGRGTANNNASNTRLMSGMWAKPIVQNLSETAGGTSVSPDIEMELGQTYTWRYTAFETNDVLKVGNKRGIVFKSGSITFTTATAIPTITTTAATCASGGTASISNYAVNTTYTFNPAGPTVATGGAISGMVAGTSYTVSATATGGCQSTASAPFSISAQLSAPATAPVVNSSLSNTCPAITVDLNSAHTGTAPTGATLQWFTNNTHTGTALSGTQITQAGSGTYYAFYYDNIENCYSPASVAVVVTINSCTTNCNTTAAIPTNGTYSVNGVTVTSSSTGSIMTYPPTFTTCGGHTFSSGSYLVGSGAGENPPNSASAWSITFTFDKPVNNLVILLGATGHTDNENFIFNSNGGTVSLSSLSSCFSTISGNQIISGVGSLAAQGGGGVFKITAPSNFTSLTINGAGGYNGSLMAFCSASIVPAPTVAITPVSQSLCENTTPLTITASATGTGTLSYSWYRNTTNSSTGWTLIPGATSTSYVPPTTTVGTMYYYVVVTDSNGTATASNVAQVEVSSCINPCIPSPTNPDSDGDGIADACDLDDDNDGILDKIECIGYIANNVNGPWKGRTTSTVTVSASPSNTQTYSGTITADPQVNFSINQNGGDPRFSGASPTANYVITFSTPVPANEIALMIDDVSISQSPNASFKVDVDFGSGFVNPNGVFIKSIAGRSSGVGYNPTSGVPTFQYSPNTGGEDIYLKGIGTTLIKAVRITGNNLGSGDAIAYSFFAIGKCDADGDGIPNELDLDSDGDGCPDAYEGAANIPQSRLVTAGGTVAGGSTSVNQNLCGSGTCVDANGVPQLLPLPAGYSNTAGQAIGQSQSFSKNDCLDSDADGIPDWEDVDDDNDGILDTAENECLNAVIAGYPTSIPVILSTDFGRPSTGTAQNNLNLTADLSHKFGYPANSGAVIVRIYNAHVHPTADEFYVRGDLPVTRWEITGSVASVIGIEHGSDYYPGQLRSINLMDNAPLPVAHTTNVAGTWNRTASGNIYTLQNLTGTRLIDQGLLHYANLDYNNSKRFEVSTNESGPSRWSTYFIRIYPECDTDKDGIPNRLDLDSDADGCSDALEGAANILYGQLMTAGGTLSGGSTTVDKNICTTCVSTAGTNIGLPQFATPPSGYSNATGQAAGESYNSLANNCYCTKPGTPGTPDGYTKVGITIQEKQTAWPENIPNGHIALESKTQGLVITRVAHVSFVPQPTDSIANPFAGMLVYDMLDECVKLFNGVNWKCIARSCNDVFN